MAPKIPQETLAPDDRRVVLPPDDEADLERALDEADEDFEHGRHVPRDAVFPRTRLAG
jgi:hypothetical protein